MAHDDGVGTAGQHGGGSHDLHLDTALFLRTPLDYLTKKLSFIAPVEVMAGEFELEALAAGACRVLEGKERLKTFTAPEKQA